MFVIIKYKRLPMSNRLPGGCPKFLTTAFDAHQKDITEKAVAHLMLDKEVLPNDYKDTNV